MRARITVDEEFRIGTIDDRLFGSFVEHLGRVVYGGIFEPDHPRADESGFRSDVAELVQELGVSVVRYPGGNFVSGYRWEDGVGPVETRPRRLDLAWRSVEPNTFGLHEFIAWTQKVGAAPMLAFNLGTRGIDAARNLVEYCNHPGGSFWSDLRKAHGAEMPFDVELWCLGNEMDGPWQVGHKSAREYGCLAAEVAKVAKLVDPGVELIACGSSYPAMPSFPDWEETVLDVCYESVDYLSLHSYYNDNGDDLPTFLASSLGMDRFITSVLATCDFVQAKKRSRKQMLLSFDEWNVWFHSLDADRNAEPWQTAPPLLEDVYTFEDALVVGCLLMTLVRHADRVKIACLAQLINAIAPIMTRTGGASWRQTIFYPFLHMSRFGRGDALDVRVSCPSYETREYGEVAYLDATATTEPGMNSVTLFAVNRSVDEDLDVEATVRGFADLRIVEHLEMTHPDPKATNTVEKPEEVVPRAVSGRGRLDGGVLTVRLAPLSWNVIRLAPLGG